ncbi:hypothetical protein ASZ90_010666 [hydrocarbon metagenome]|uniref:Uncharacterized protein n=1 Tax=hydrocarbon metagenome TaxID=938273 RepID=A0A0W8FFD1_9ZZZZ
MSATRPVFPGNMPEQSADRRKEDITEGRCRIYEERREKAPLQ